MRCKTIGATFILLLMTQVISAQENSGSNPFRPGVHLKNDAPSRTKEQKEYDKAIDREYRSKLKEIPEAGKRDPWANIRPTPPGAAKNTQ
jgi:Na+-transporting NADH:ubiquinone oxidoreductase subunit NqrF